MSYEGVLPIRKPLHFTSHDVVAKLRGILGEKRIGHTGTLDPLVIGVLPVCIGRATRIAEYIQDLPKTYEAELTLGYATDTEDRSGTVVQRLHPEEVHIDDTALRVALNRLTGEIQQVPPMYSAVKLRGQKLYHLARQGIEVERPARVVTIYEIQLLKRSISSVGYPAFHIRVTCSKGTYIRTLCKQIGEQLHVPAVMTDLIRTKSGGFTLAESLELTQVEVLHKEGKLDSRLVSTDEAITHFPRITLAEPDSVVRAMTGQRIPHIEEYQLESGQLYRLYAHNEQFLGLFKPDDTATHLIPKKVWN